MIFFLKLAHQLLVIVKSDIFLKFLVSEVYIKFSLEAQ